MLCFRIEAGIISCQGRAQARTWVSPASLSAAFSLMAGSYTSIRQCGYRRRTSASKPRLSLEPRLNTQHGFVPRTS